MYKIDPKSGRGGPSVRPSEYYSFENLLITAPAFLNLIFPMLSTVIKKMRELGSLYEWSDDREPLEMAERLEKAIAYYTAGFRRSRKEGSNANMLEYNEHLQLLEELRQVIIAMVDTACDEGSLTLIDEWGVELNLRPMLDFLSKHDVEDVCGQLSSIMELIVKYSTPKNQRNMQNAYRVCDEFRIYFTVLKRCN